MNLALPSLEILKKKNIIGELLDCPCGTGETSYHFSNISDKITVTAIDIDINQIEFGRKAFGDNITFKIQSIISTLKTNKYAIICIINSLFLFKNAKEVLNLAFRSLRTNGNLYIITPNINSKNFKNYQKLNPYSNQFIFSEKEAYQIFNSCGFQVEKHQYIATFMTYPSITIFKGFHLLRNIFIFITSFFIKSSNLNNGHYILYVLKKL